MGTIERPLNAINHRQPERPPVYVSLTPQVAAKLCEALLNKSRNCIRIYCDITIIGRRATPVVQDPISDDDIDSFAIYLYVVKLLKNNLIPVELVIIN